MSMRMARYALGLSIVMVAGCINNVDFKDMLEQAKNEQYGLIATYIKGNKGGKLGLSGIENITMAPAETKIPWPGQKLRFVLIFPPLPDDATEFDFIVPSSEWKFKDIKCR